MQKLKNKEEKTQDMGQGDSFIESANNIQGMNEYLGWIQFTSITKDEVFC